MMDGGTMSRPDGALERPRYMRKPAAQQPAQQQPAVAPAPAPQPAPQAATSQSGKPLGGLFARAAQTWQQGAQQPAAQTFRQMQAAGQARPAPPPPAPAPAPAPVQQPAPQAAAPGQFQAPASATGGAMVDRLQQLLANPSAERAQGAQMMYDQQARGIDDQFAMQEQAMREEMAARGLADSSIQGGRLADLNVGKRSAQTELADRLMQQLAEASAQDQQAALGLGMQYDNQQFGQDLAGFQANQQAAQYGQSLAEQQRQADMANQLAQQNFGLNQQGQLFGQGYQQQQADRGYELARDQFGLQRGEQQFNQGLATRGQDFQEEIGRGQFGLQAGYYDIAREGSIYDQLAQLLGLSGDTSLAANVA